VTKSTTRIDLTDERLAAYGRLVETQRRLHRVFDRSLQEHVGISIVVYEALLRLARGPEGHLTINELGEAMGLSSGGATRLVDRLEAQGFVERLSCPSDRRVSWASLTDGGREKLDDATAVHLADLDEHLVSRLQSDQLETLRDLLRSLRPVD
jgi:MarR family 2-MHQ and catechol resistance regulon transcriptional repressor